MTRELRTEAILAMMAKLRAAIPRRNAAAAAPPAEEERALPPAQTIEDFEEQAVIDAVDSVARELRASIDAAHAEILARALNAYYAAEELARDPAHAHLIPHVEAMRKAYEAEYGRPIPPRQ